jgi:5-methylcytosine-specific restriction enzyme subunit McrC
MNRPPIRLTEWTPKPDNQLTLEEVARLRSALPSLQITPDASPGRYTLRSASNEVGFVELDGLSVSITPGKCSASLVVFMMSYAVGADAFEEPLAPFHDDESVWEAMVMAFKHQLDRALRPGVHRGYRHEEEALPTIRGRIRLEDQLRRRFRLAPPVEVAYDDFTEDITENRILKAAIDRCHHLPLRSAPLRQSLRHHEHMLVGVQAVPLDPRRLPAITWTRLNGHLRSAVELGAMILRHTSISLEHGEVSSPGFLVDMAKVFEDFVVVGLREALLLDHHTFIQGSTTLRLAKDIALKPDFSWWAGHDCVAVGDVKYKVTTAEGVLHPDLYQVFAYATAAELPEATLVYAGSKGDKVDDPPATVHDVTVAGKRLRVEVLDLDQGPEVALNELQRIANSLSSSLVSTA